MTSGCNRFAARRAALFVAACVLVSAVVAAPTGIEARGLMRDMAVLVIDGRQVVLRVGERTDDGVELVAATPARATVRVNGRSYDLGLSEQVGARFAAPTRQQVRIARDGQGHFRVGGTVEGQPVSFLVDTGATVLAMSSQQADALGIDYASAGNSTQVLTAGGPAPSYYVDLKVVQVGGITLNGVQAAIVEGAYPAEILLGMSFLRHVGLNENAGVLTLTREF